MIDKSLDGQGLVFSLQILRVHWVSQSSTWIPQLPQRHFCPWMTTKLFLLKGIYEWGMSYLAILLMWLLWEIAFLTSSQERHLLLVLGLQFKNHCSRVFKVGINLEMKRQLFWGVECSLSSESTNLVLGWACLSKGVGIPVEDTGH